MGKILVTYHSGYGATAAAAKIIADTLTEKGFKVDLCDIGLEDLAKYNVYPPDKN
jgi:menaquinone-dependent protoporphyrinogen IX oxidase